MNREMGFGNFKLEKNIGMAGAPAVPHHFERVGSPAHGAPVALTLTALAPKIPR
jgi:hypothetical protein